MDTYNCQRNRFIKYARFFLNLYITYLIFNFSFYTKVYMHVSLILRIVGRDGEEEQKKEREERVVSFKQREKKYGCYQISTNRENAHRNRCLHHA